MSETPRTQRTKAADEIPGYDYGSAAASKSPIDTQELARLEQSAGFTDEDQKWLRVAGEVLADQAKALVEKWRGVIASLPHLARYSLRPDGQREPRYSERSGLRFEQWVLDTCLRPYDQDWLNYQHEIALRHTTVKKNKTDGVESAPTVHLRHIIAFGAVVTSPEMMKPFLRARNHSEKEVEKMYEAWCKSIFLQLALWSEPYTRPELAAGQW